MMGCLLNITYSIEVAEESNIDDMMWSGERT